tara:strand:- start:32 stop:253 length:222 start_codon:yes stop_codon:yes gene_type:complete
MISTVEKIYNEYGTSSGTFKVTKQDGTILWVPKDEANSDYQAIQEWIAAGGIVIDNAPSGTEADGGTVIDNGE